MSTDKDIEKVHYTIAWFCSVLFFFFLGAWYLSTKQTVLYISGNLWSIILLLYGIVNVSYHCYRKAMPYVGERRFLVFADAFFIALCALTGFSSIVVLILIQIQIVLTLISIRQEKYIPKTFFSLYSVVLMVLCLLVSDYSSYKIMTFIVVFCGISIFILSFWYAMNMLIKSNSNNWDQKVQQIQEHHIAMNFQMQQKIRDAEKTLNTTTRAKQQQKKSLHCVKEMFSLLNNPMQLKVWQKFTEKTNISLEQVILLECSKSLKKVNVENILSEAFFDIAQKKITINRSEDFVNKIEIQEPISSFVIYQWLFYISQQNTEKFSIMLSQNDENIHIKAILKADIAPASSGTNCPICQKNVRALHEYKNTTSCLQCCRKILESEIEESLPLCKKIINYYKLGNIQCGISSWDNYEYFLSIVFFI